APPLPETRVDERSQEVPAEGATSSFRDRLDGDVQLSLADHGHFYSPGSLAALGLGVAAAAPLANTSADQHFRDWYQRHVKDDSLDPLANVACIGGQAWVVGPVCLESAILAGWVD